jgi:hypothetical protein
MGSIAYLGQASIFLPLQTLPEPLPHLVRHAWATHLLEAGHLYQRLAIDLVDVADGRKIEADERLQLRQIGSVQKV